MRCWSLKYAPALISSRSRLSARFSALFTLLVGVLLGLFALLVGVLLGLLFLFVLLVLAVAFALGEGRAATKGRSDASTAMAVARGSKDVSLLDATVSSALTLPVTAHRSGAAVDRAAVGAATAKRSAAGRRRAAAAGDVAERDAALGQVVGRHFQRHVVAGDDADVVLAHLAAGVADHLVAVLERHAKTRVGQHFVHVPLHLDQFFLGHVCLLCGLERGEGGALNAGVAVADPLQAFGGGIAHRGELGLEQPGQAQHAVVRAAARARADRDRTGVPAVLEQSWSGAISGTCLR